MTLLSLRAPSLLATPLSRMAIDARGSSGSPAIPPGSGPRGADRVTACTGTLDRERDDCHGEVRTSGTTELLALDLASSPKRNFGAWSSLTTKTREIGPVGTTVRVLDRWKEKPHDEDGTPQQGSPRDGRGDPESSTMWGHSLPAAAVCIGAGATIALVAIFG